MKNENANTSESTGLLKLFTTEVKVEIFRHTQKLKPASSKDLIVHMQLCSTVKKWAELKHIYEIVEKWR